MRKSIRERLTRPRPKPTVVKPTLNVRPRPPRPIRGLNDRKKNNNGTSAMDENK